MTLPLKQIILAVLTLNLCACVDVLEDDNDSAEAQAFKAQLTAHTWQSEEKPLNGSLAQVTWEFYENKKFSHRHSFRGNNGNRSEVLNSGQYSIGNVLVMTSGHSAFELNLNFNYNEDLEPEPNPLRLNQYHTILISDNSLYFGQNNPTTSCEGEYYLLHWLLSGDNDEEVLLEDYLNLNTSNGSQTCYVRPVTMDFDKPYSIFTMASTIQ